MPDPDMEVLDGVGHSVDQEMEEVEDVEPFPLDVLPVSIVARVLEMMEPHEMLNLALTTPKMEAFFKHIRVGITNFVIHFSGESSAIQLQSDGGTIICGTDPLNAKVMVPRETIQSWINQETLLGDLQSVYRNLCQMFRPHYHDTVVLRTTGLDHLLLEESGFVRDRLRNCEIIIVAGGEISKEALDMVFLLSGAEPTDYRELELRSVQVPVDFETRNAFQFRRSIFDDARWVKLNDLFKIRDLSHVTLKKTNLTSSDMNQFIKHWINADEDMFGEFYSTGCEEFLRDKILDGIVTLEVKRLRIGCYFIASRPSSNKTYPYLAVIVSRNKIKMLPVTFEKHGAAESHEFELTKRECDVLEKLQRKVFIEEMLASNTMQDLRPRMMRELELIGNFLRKYKVIFVEGRARMYYRP
ncbi:hypothetical protein B9Z55_005038 [Caenorhabditis nigoni]|uniref:F-box domain-containing protein n=2 Tax=Caenorhabditis nigoni TaxID=1611254 RepID=A0A2G5UZ67_9PELO|nr:hypothetical protein B9Z55_005038 [Caenorhabditis nigoni]